MALKTKIWALSLLIPSFCFAAEGEESHEMHHGMVMEKEAHSMAMAPGECDPASYWDYSFGTCSPLSKEGRKEWMVHGNAFFTLIAQEGPRGRDGFAVPHMLMGDFGYSLGDRHHLGVNLMLTGEKWTFPDKGYPLLFQIGEEDKNGRPYIDGQHPHSSPIMGLTLSDTIRLGEEKNHLKVFFAPRGQATEGPTAFMHRPTGMVNPNPPLGHHIGQDVSHITSTVLGASLGLGATRLEASAFYGEEPEPDKVDLKLGGPNSYAGRIIQELGENFSIMASFAYLKEPEHDDPTLDHVWRYSASLYHHHDLGRGWMLHNTAIYGLVNFYDHVSSLQSVLDELWLHSKDGPYNIWGRIEFVERAPIQLAIPGAREPLDPKWVTALTLGYTHNMGKIAGLEFGLGLSGTQYFVPNAFRGTYGGNPKGGQIFLQTRGMAMGPL